MQVHSYLHLVLESLQTTGDRDEDDAKEFRSHFTGSLALLRPLMLKHLPPGIAGALYPAEYAPPCLDWDPSVREAAGAWCADWDADWDRACRRSREDFLGIKNALPEALQKFTESFSLHDARFLSVDTVKEDTLILTMDCSGCLTHTGLLELRFHGVQSTEELQPGIAGGFWLYDELERTAGGSFDWKALVHGLPCTLEQEGGIPALREIRIVARSFEFRHTTE
ncbi:DUF4085 family protein [Paenibacillus sp. S-38]|uniref:DUF4085 family protein n=1 Tax=Paenibacillus sp. S-38 TaxID=3416710 RepID=UPI003CF26174